MKKIIVVMGVGLMAAFLMESCKEQEKGQARPQAEREEVVLKDYGAEPTVLNIDDYTIANENFRAALWTGIRMQVTVMSIPVGGEVGLEIHPDIEQFLRIEEGEGEVQMGDSKEDLNFRKKVTADYAVFVPAGKWHNIVNTGDQAMKLYSIYSPVEHPHGTIHKTAEEAAEAEHHH